MVNDEFICQVNVSKSLTELPFEAISVIRKIYSQSLSVSIRGLNIQVAPMGLRTRIDKLHRR